MRVFRFFFFFILTAALTVALCFPIVDKPALGNLLNPFTGFWNNAENNKIHLAPEIDLRQLRDSVSIYFDEHRIPHIFAENEHDLYYAQGYVTASLRLWQMEFQVLAAEGRISEIIGPKAIDFDIEKRRKGMTYGAQNKLRVIMDDPWAKGLIDSYTDGVNAYINELPSRDLPIEYKLMSYKPELWSPYRTALLLMNMSEVLSSTEYDIEHSNFVAEYGQELFDTLYNQWPKDLEPIFPTPSEGWKSSLEAISNKDDLLEPADTLPVSLGDLGIKTKTQIGSNNWVVSGKRTLSGDPLLANDPHLSLTFPSVWLEMHLNAPGVNVYGVSFPGSPGIIIGFNDNIGWGVTNAGRDVKDWYTIEYKDDSKEFYKWGNGWRKTEMRVEEIKVKGQDPTLDTVYYTHLGPVYHENIQTNIGEVNLALQWMAHHGGEEYKTFYELNHAKNYAEYLSALQYYSCPAQNFIFASVDGDIALRQQGRFPILKEEEGLFIQDGSLSDTWDEFIPFDNIPTLKNPKRNFLSSANQHVADSTYPYYTNGVFEYYRNRIINNELRKMGKAEVADMKALQYNDFNLMAAEALPPLLAYLDNDASFGNEGEVLQELKNWDYFSTSTSKAATYYDFFFNNYYTLLWDEMTNGVAHSWANYTMKTGMDAPNQYNTITLLKDSIDHPFIDNQSTTAIENTQDLVRLAFSQTLEDVENLEQAEWGAFKSTQINHVAKIPAFSTTVDVGGGYKMVNASGRYHGPSWRMILDFSDGKINGIGVYPGGQSGNPGSLHYDNLVNDWKEGNYHELNHSSNPTTFEQDAYSKIKLKPGI